ncbi:Peptidoglycan/xylan/chitin deacetylase, PgdA/CDA1 family [Raineyella antarctica]|uniref:Peptidoglycan/xylan/chitin deacetylase, PgdA/CDA1 family n=1 Tax=Raineyella antarctica TaxID=1577474 RepID=A0A1G6GFC4_9ACTN|nr:polysaccharide deacetylase family protein [Raineyella antarctica]SDB80697.1 Peptidoglycan/xylan/chitin deacetylase, PgdA/CDA1 family [Raineyella antarctica]
MRPNRAPSHHGLLAVLVLLATVLFATVVLAACAPPSRPPAPAPSPTPSSAVVAGTDHNAAAQAYAYPAAKVQEWVREGTRAPDLPAQKVAFLTFDDGPSTDATPRVLDALHATGVPATFFIIAGPQGLGRAGAPLLQREMAEGNAVCIHSYSHDYGYLYPRRKADTEHILSDQARALDALRGALGPGYSPDCFRYPGGHMSWTGLAAADAGLTARGLSWIDWNTMTGDAEPRKKEPRTPAEAARNVKTDIAHAGNPPVVVVLMHDAPGKRISTEALPLVVADLRAAGYAFGVIG